MGLNFNLKVKNIDQEYFINLFYKIFQLFSILISLYIKLYNIIKIILGIYYCFLKNIYAFFYIKYLHIFLTSKL